MTVMTSGRRIGLRASGLSCLLAACLPATAFAAQSAVCMQASLAHAAHNAKEAAKLDLQCRLSSIKSGGGAGAAAAQAQARQAHLDQLRANILARQQQEQAQQQQQQQQQQRQRPYPVQARPAQPGAYPAAPTRPSIFSALGRLRSAQAAAAAAPAYGVAPAAPPAPMPTAPPPAATVVPASDSAPPPPDPLDAVLTPGPRDTSLTNDQAVAARAKTDMSVFGVALGDPLTRPKCVRGAPSLEPCVAQTGFSMLVATLFRPRLGKLSDFSNVPLHLPEAQCPDWLKAGSCDVVLAMAGGYVYAAFMVVGGEDTQAVIETQLTQKYGKRSDKGPLSQCKSGGSAAHPNAPLRSWSMRGLRVEYDPYGATCAYGAWRRGTGQLVVETDTFRRMVTEAGTATEPKM